MPTIRRRTDRQTQGQMAVAFCDHCGDGIPCDGSGVRLAPATGLRFCGDECASAEGYVRCGHCGGYLPASSAQVIAVGDAFYCSERCARTSGHERCEQCGEWFSAEGGDWVPSYDAEGTLAAHYCGELCATLAGAVQCADCGEYIQYIGYQTRSGIVCEDCLGRRYHHCETCGVFARDDDWDEDAECCSHCIEQGEGERHLHCYGYRPPTEFFGDDRDREVPFLGVELETDISSSDLSRPGERRSAYCNALRQMEQKKRFWLTEDGSLACGVEVTSQPMTLEEHIECGMWARIREIAIEHGFTSHDNGRCGLHVHVNRDFFGKSEKRQNVGGYNLAMLVSRFEKQLTQFSRRQSNRWCNYGIHHEFIDKKHPGFKDLGIFEKSREMCIEKSYAHAQCVNFEHSATFEIRIFRGTLRLETLYATLAMAHGLASAAKHHGQTWCEQTTWHGLTSCILANLPEGTPKDALKAYMTERGVG